MTTTDNGGWWTVKVDSYGVTLTLKSKPPISIFTSFAEAESLHTALDSELLEIKVRQQSEREQRDKATEVASKLQLRGVVVTSVTGYSTPNGPQWVVYVLHDAVGAFIPADQWERDGDFITTVYEDVHVRTYVPRTT